ncbi:MAG TPA: hypothetical protein VFK05_32785 [Polyangiaceae bacterium]|nr:hypothetical protein [Polyangiaceae bacterium]
MGAIAVPQRTSQRASFPPQLETTLSAAATVPLGSLRIAKIAKGAKIAKQAARIRGTESTGRRPKDLGFAGRDEGRDIYERVDGQ